MINHNNETLDKHLYAHITAQRFEVGNTPGKTDSSNVLTMQEQIEIHEQVKDYLNAKQKSRTVYLNGNPGSSITIASENYKR